MPLMPQTQFTVPSRNFTVGTTTFNQSLPAGKVQKFAISCDAALWTAAGTVEVEVLSSFDNGASFQPTVSVLQTEPPPWPLDHGETTSLIAFSTDYGADISPTNVRLRVTVTGQTVRLGPTVVTVN